MLIIRTNFLKNLMVKTTIVVMVGLTLVLFMPNAEQPKRSSAPGNPLEKVTKKTLSQEPVAEPTPSPVQTPVTEPQFIALPVSMDEGTQKTVSEICGKYNVPFTLVMALIETESNFQPNLISRTNDYGLMQINKCNHKRLSAELGITDFLNPSQNVEAGCYMLSELLYKYKDLNVVLMAYNMGEGNAKKLWKQGVWSSKYSNKIMARKQEFDNQTNYTKN